MPPPPSQQRILFEENKVMAYPITRITHHHFVRRPSPILFSYSKQPSHIPPTRPKTKRSNSACCSTAACSAGHYSRAGRTRGCCGCRQHRARQSAREHRARGDRQGAGEDPLQQDRRRQTPRHELSRAALPDQEAGDRIDVRHLAAISRLRG